MPGAHFEIAYGAIFFERDHSFSAVVRVDPDG